MRRSRWGVSRHRREHLQDRRHEHGVGHALGLELVEHGRRVELADEDRGGALGQPQVGPGDAADVEHRSGVSDTESASNDHTGTRRHAAARLRWVVSTPFGTPVVPDVYICRTGSSASPRAPGSTGAAAASHASYSSPTATTRRSRGTAAATSRATSTNSGPATSMGALASVTTVVSSGAASRQFSGTATAPSFAQG